MRRVGGGINWIWYVTDTEEDAIKWYIELTGKEPSYHEICDMRDGTFGFRIHR